MKIKTAQEEMTKQSQELTNNDFNINEKHFTLSRSPTMLLIKIHIFYQKCLYFCRAY